MPEVNEFGFKRLTPENWLTVDPAWSGVVMSSSLPDRSEGWVHDLVRVQLGPGVPLNIRKLFETARGTLAYSVMFYPLLTLGAEQLLRILETAAADKCKAMNAPSKQTRTFESKIDWLGTSGVLTNDQKLRWHAIRHLRNDASHPKDQNIFAPGMALTILDATAELINPLFGAS